MDEPNEWKIRQRRLTPLVVFVILGFLDCVLILAVINPEIFNAMIPWPIAVIVGIITTCLALTALSQFFIPLSYLHFTSEGISVLVNRLTRRRLFVPWKNVRGIGEASVARGGTSYDNPNRTRRRAIRDSAIMIQCSFGDEKPKIRGKDFWLNSRCCKFPAYITGLDGEEIIEKIKQIKQS